MASVYKDVMPASRVELSSRKSSCSVGAFGCSMRTVQVISLRFCTSERAPPILSRLLLEPYCADATGVTSHYKNDDAHKVDQEEKGKQAEPEVEEEVAQRHLSRVRHIQARSSIRVAQRQLPRGRHRPGPSCRVAKASIGLQRTGAARGNVH